MNVADSEVVLSILNDSGYTRTEELSHADVVFVNTCAVRENAEQRIYGRIGDFKHLKKSNPAVVVGVLGCMAERLRKDLLQSESSVDLVVGPDEYRRLPELVDHAIQGEKGIAVRLSRVENYDDIIPLRTDGISAWVSVMRGCDKFCTFCVVPFTRGRERSRSLRSVTQEIAGLLERGFKEVTLLGQNVNSYRDEEAGFDFADLMAAVARLDPSLRVRFTTSHPQDMSDKLIATIASHRNICKYIHLPVQSGSDRILQLMNRTYTSEEYRALVGRIRRVLPKITLSTDIIAGFPTETDADHQMTMNLLQEMQYDGAFTFKYSPRANTKAWHMGDSVPEETKIQRLNEIIEFQRAISFRRNQTLIGTEEEILVEGPSRKSNNDLVGRTDSNRMVVFSQQGVRAGEYRRVRVERANSATLFGTIVRHSAEQRIAVNG